MPACRHRTNLTKHTSAPEAETACLRHAALAWRSLLARGSVAARTSPSTTLHSHGPLGAPAPFGHRRTVPSTSIHAEPVAVLLRLPSLTARCDQPADICVGCRALYIFHAVERLLAFPVRPPTTEQQVCPAAGVQYATVSGRSVTLLAVDAFWLPPRPGDRRPAATSPNGVDRGMGAYPLSVVRPRAAHEFAMHEALTSEVASAACQGGEVRVRGAMPLASTTRSLQTETDEADALGVLWHGFFEPARLRLYPQYRTKLMLASGSAPALCGMCAGSVWLTPAQPRLRRSGQVRRTVMAVGS